MGKEAGCASGRPERGDGGRWRRGSYTSGSMNVPAPSPVRSFAARSLVLAALVPLGSACETEGERPPPASRTAAPETSPRSVPAFQLEDQFGAVHRYDGRSDAPVALFVSRREAADTNLEWDRWITPRYGEALRILRVLDLSDVPGVFRGIAISFVKDRAKPPETPILLDWEGTLLERLGLEGGTSNLIVVAPDGSIVLAISGPPEPGATARVASSLDGLLASAR